MPSLEESLEIRSEKDYEIRERERLLEGVTISDRARPFVVFIYSWLKDDIERHRIRWSISMIERLPQYEQDRLLFTPDIRTAYDLLSKKYYAYLVSLHILIDQSPAEEVLERIPLDILGPNDDAFEVFLTFSTKVAFLGRLLLQHQKFVTIQELVFAFANKCVRFFPDNMHTKDDWMKVNAKAQEYITAYYFLGQYFGVTTL